MSVFLCLGDSRVVAYKLGSAGPVAVIEGLDVPAQRPSIPQGGPSYGYLPPLTAQDRNKFMKIFFNCGPKNGVLGGDTARELFMRSKLTMEQLAQVWYVVSMHTDREKGSNITLGTSPTETTPDISIPQGSSSPCTSSKPQ